MVYGLIMNYLLNWHFIFIASIPLVLPPPYLLQPSCIAMPRPAIASAAASASDPHGSRYSSGHHGQGQAASGATDPGPASHDHDVDMEVDVKKKGDDQKMHDSQKKKFEKMEAEARLRNIKPTPMECHQVTFMNVPSQIMRDNTTKVMSLFGNAKGAGKACKNVIESLAVLHSLQKGDVVPVMTTFFTFCKHIFASQCNSFGTPGSPGKPKVEDVTQCWCLPATSFMPRGCCHTNLKLWKMENIYTSFCIPCSKCLRCGK